MDDLVLDWIPDFEIELFRQWGPSLSNLAAAQRVRSTLLILRPAGHAPSLGIRAPF
jgi:hypothetical protein